jgi:predicted AAA+ superfamily ATPase
MVYKRQIESGIIHDLQNSNKIILLYGPRQVGKTTLCK